MTDSNTNYHSLYTEEKGVAILETAMTIGIFFGVLFGGMEIILSMHRALGATHASVMAARFSTTKGRTAPDAIAALKSNVNLYANSYGFTVYPDQIHVCPVDKCDSNPNLDSLGEAGDFISLRITVPVGSPTLKLIWNHTVSATFRNEGDFRVIPFEGKAPKK